MTINDLKLKLHNQHLTVLAVYRFVQTTTFAEAYDSACDDQKSKADELIKELKYELLIDWTKRKLADLKLYGIMSMTQLRTLAKNKRIPYYAALTRNQLIEAIERNAQRNSSTPQ